MLDIGLTVVRSILSTFGVAQLVCRTALLPLYWWVNVLEAMIAEALYMCGVDLYTAYGIEYHANNGHLIDRYLSDRITIFLLQGRGSLSPWLKYGMEWVQDNQGPDYLNVQPTEVVIKEGVVDSKVFLKTDIEQLDALSKKYSGHTSILVSHVAAPAA